jgi:hypothetical protein
MLRIRVRWCRLNMTVGRQDADVPRQHDHRENEKPPPGNHDAISHQPHWTNSTRLAMTVKRRGGSGPAHYQSHPQREACVVIGCLARISSRPWRSRLHGSQDPRGVTGRSELSRPADYRPGRRVGVKSTKSHCSLEIGPRIRCLSSRSRDPADFEGERLCQRRWWPKGTCMVVGHDLPFKVRGFALRP